MDKNERLEQFSAEQRKKFLPIAPDFIVELRSESDSLSEQQAKMEEWTDNGVRLAWLIDTKTKRVYIYSFNSDAEVLDHPSKVSGGDLLPGFELDLTQIW